MTATLPMQCCKAAGVLADMPPCSEHRAVSKSTCTAMRGAGLRSQCTVTCRKHGVRSCWEAHVSSFDAQVNVSHHVDNNNPPPPTLLPPGFNFYQVHQWQMLPQDHAYEYAEQCCGRRAALCPCRNANESCPAFVAEVGKVCLLSANLFGCGGKQEVCEVNLRGEWPYLAGSDSGWE